MRIYQPKFIILLLIFSGFPAFIIAADIQLTPLWEKETGLFVPNEPVLDDLNYDNIPELIVTDIKGHLVVFNAVTGERIWSRSFKNIKLTAASVGNFLEDYPRHLALGSGDGFVYICEGMTGKVLLKIDVGADVIFPPTPVYLGLSEGSSIQEGLVVIDSKGKVHLYELTSNKNLIYNKRWSLWTGARVTSPASIGFVTGKNHPDVIVGTTAGDIWVINVMHRQDKTPLKFTNLSRRPPIKIIVPMELTGDAQQELVFYDEGNNLNAIRYEAGNLILLWSEVPVYGAPAARPISIDLNQDGKREIIISSPQALNCILGSIGERCWQRPYNVLANIVAGPALFMTREKTPLLFLTDERALGHFINVHSGTEYALVKFKNNQPLYSALLADIQGDGFLDIVGMDSRGLRIFAYQTNIPVEPKRFFWLSTGGNAYLTSSIDGFYWEHRDRLFQRAKVYVSEELSIAKAAAENSNWHQAKLHARNVLRLNPFELTARRIYRQAWIYAHIIIIILGLIAILALASATGIAFIRFFHRQALLHKANQFISQQKSAEAIRILKNLFKKDPTNKHIASLLAGELIKLGDFSPVNIPVFELAYAAHKNEISLLKALAIAYNNARIQNDTALAVYLSAYPNLENRAPFAFRIAQIYQEKGELQKSAKFLREAIRCGLESDEVYKRLTEVYLAMNCSEPKVIKVFERVYPEYKDNPEFLKLLATAYQQAKRTDAQAREVYEKVLQVQPGFLPALIQMAQIKIEENKLDEAERFAEATLNIDNDNGAGLLLLSQCYLLRDRQDNKAIKIYEQTLRHYPENKDILRVLAVNYWQKQRLDEEARAIYTRAYRYHQNNPEILFAMSKVEENLEHPELVAEIGERLVQMRLALPEHYLWLARAYQRLHIVEPKAIEIYQRALTIEPDNVNFLFLLGESLISQDRKDADSIAVYEKILQADSKQIKFAKQLARAYIQNQLYEKCLSVTTEMLKLFPGEKDLLHLRAQASLLNNQIDEAIREYKRILQENPDDEIANVNLALALAQKVRTDDEAAAQYELALKYQPNNIQLHRIMARVLARRNQFASAVNELRIAYQHDPRILLKIIQDCRDILSQQSEATPVRWFLVELLLVEGRFREAIKELDVIFAEEPEKIDSILAVYEQILRKDPSNVLALLRSGMLMKVKGEFERARQAIERAYELKPDDPDVQNELAELYELILSEQDNNEVRYYLGKIYFIMGDYDRAISCFQKAAQDFRWESDALKMLGRCFVAKGMLDLALQEFRKLVVDNELKELLYDLAQRYERKQDLVGAKTVYKHLFAADIDYKDVRQKFELFAGSTSDPLVFEKTTILSTLSEKAKLRYELLEEVGRGAMGIVYRAKDNELEETVALKILPDNLSNNPEALNRFKLEARSARRLTHPHIVRIHDIGEEMGRKYISMEFVEGTDLKRLLKREHKLPWQKAIRYGYQIVDALAYAHSIGIIHRDIKPANILITHNDNIKITDFGIAKVMESTEVTLAGSVIGTPLYMSPEQIQGLSVDARADIYSVGIMLYEIIKGRPPFVEGDLAYQHLHVQPEPLTDVPPEVNETIMRCLKKKREERWADALQLRAQLEKIAITYNINISRSS